MILVGSANANAPPLSPITVAGKSHGPDCTYWTESGSASNSACCSGGTLFFGFARLLIAMAPSPMAVSMVFAVVGGGPRAWVAGLGDLFVVSALEPYWTLVVSVRCARAAWEMRRAQRAVQGEGEEDEENEEEEAKKGKDWTSSYLAATAVRLL
jgi:hypothetical protein